MIGSSISENVSKSISLFKCDLNGNNALHLCVYHSLPEMYECVYDIAKTLLTRELRQVYSENIILKTEPNDLLIDKKLRLKLDLTNCITLKKNDLFMPNKENFETWLVEEAEKIIIADFAVALNQNLHR